MLVEDTGYLQFIYLVPYTCSFPMAGEYNFELSFAPDVSYNYMGMYL